MFGRGRRGAVELILDLQMRAGEASLVVLLLLADGYRFRVDSAASQCRHPHCPGAVSLETHLAQETGIMSTDVQVVEPQQSLRSAAQLMKA